MADASFLRLSLGMETWESRECKVARRRWIVNPVYAAPEPALGNITPSQDHTPSLACQIILVPTWGSLELSIGR